jgi:PRTRC genetic system protein B
MNEDLTKPLVPTQMIVIYEQRKGTEEQKDAYIERSALTEKDGKYIPGPMMPLEADHIGNLVSLLRKKDKARSIGGYIPPHVKYFLPNDGKPTILWVRPPQKYKIFWAKEVKLKEELIRKPAMVYLLKDGGLRIWCVKDKIIRPATKLYRLPLPNSYENGTICWGNTKHLTNMAGTIEMEIQLWEGRFWNSEFAHMGGKDALHKLWAGIVNGKKIYPPAKLNLSGTKQFKNAMSGLPAITI